MICMRYKHVIFQQKINQIQSDHGKEFENSYMESFCIRSGISQEFSTLITPQQNGVVERKNRVIQ